MSFCFQLGHSSVALTPERSVASCPRRWMTGMTGYLGRWVPSVIFYVHFSFWLTVFIQNVISHHLYEIKICCLNNISFQNLYKILLLFSKFLIIFFFTWLILLFFTYEHASKNEIHYLHVYVFQSRKNTNITQYQTCKEIYILPKVSTVSLISSTLGIGPNDIERSLKISPIQCIWYIFAVYIVYSTVYMVYFIFYSVHGIFYSVNIISMVYMVYFTV